MRTSLFLKCVCVCKILGRYRRNLMVSLVNKARNQVSEDRTSAVSISVLCWLIFLQVCNFIIINRSWKAFYSTSVEVKLKKPQGKMWQAREKEKTFPPLHLKPQSALCGAWQRNQLSVDAEFAVSSKLLSSIPFSSAWPLILELLRFLFGGGSRQWP